MVKLLNKLTRMSNLLIYLSGGCIYTIYSKASAAETAWALMVIPAIIFAGIAAVIYGDEKE